MIFELSRKWTYFVCDFDTKSSSDGRFRGMRVFAQLVRANIQPSANRRNWDMSLGRRAIVVIGPY